MGSRPHRNSAGVIAVGVSIARRYSGEAGRSRRGQERHREEGGGGHVWVARSQAAATRKRRDRREGAGWSGHAPPTPCRPSAPPSLPVDPSLLRVVVGPLMMIALMMGLSRSNSIKLNVHLVAPRDASSHLVAPRRTALGGAAQSTTASPRCRLLRGPFLSETAANGQQHPTQKGPPRNGTKRQATALRAPRRAP